MKHVRDMTEPEIQRMCARTYLAEARRRRGQPFAATLLQWARNARNRANARRPPSPVQGDLFGRGYR
jgi:hypothetical protein